MVAIRPLRKWICLVLSFLMFFPQPALMSAETHSVAPPLTGAAITKDGRYTLYFPKGAYDSNAIRISKELFFDALFIEREKLWVNLAPSLSSKALEWDLRFVRLGRVLLESDLLLKQKAQQAIKQVLINEWVEGIGEPADFYPRLVIEPKEISLVEYNGAIYIECASMRVRCYLDREADSERFGWLAEKIEKPLTDEVNTAREFAPLRAAFSAALLADALKGKGNVPKSLEKMPFPVNLVDAGLDYNAYIQGYRSLYYLGRGVDFEGLNISIGGIDLLPDGSVQLLNRNTAPINKKGPAVSGKLRLVSSLALPIALIMGTVVLLSFNAYAGDAPNTASDMAASYNWLTRPFDLARAGLTSDEQVRKVTAGLVLLAIGGFVIVWLSNERLRKFVFEERETSSLAKINPFYSTPRGEYYLHRFQPWAMYLEYLQKMNFYLVNFGYKEFEYNMLRWILILFLLTGPQYISDASDFVKISAGAALIGGGWHLTIRNAMVNRFSKMEQEAARHLFDNMYYYVRGYPLSKLKKDYAVLNQLLLPDLPEVPDYVDIKTFCQQHNIKIGNVIKCLLLMMPQRSMDIPPDRNPDIMSRVRFSAAVLSAQPEETIWEALSKIPEGVYFWEFIEGLAFRTRPDFDRLEETMSIDVTSFSAVRELPGVARGKTNEGGFLRPELGIALALGTLGSVLLIKGPIETFGIFAAQSAVFGVSAYLYRLAIQRTRSQGPELNFGAEENLIGLFKQDALRSADAKIRIARYRAIWGIITAALTAALVFMVEPAPSSIFLLAVPLVSIGAAQYPVIKEQTKVRGRSTHSLWFVSARGGVLDRFINESRNDRWLHLRERSLLAFYLALVEEAMSRPDGPDQSVLWAAWNELLDVKKKRTISEEDIIAAIEALNRVKSVDGVRYENAELLLRLLLAAGEERRAQLSSICWGGRLEGEKNLRDIIGEFVNSHLETEPSGNAYNDYQTFLSFAERAIANQPETPDFILAKYGSSLARRAIDALLARNRLIPESNLCDEFFKELEKIYIREAEFKRNDWMSPSDEKRLFLGLHIVNGGLYSIGLTRNRYVEGVDDNYNQMDVETALRIASEILKALSQEPAVTNLSPIFTMDLSLLRGRVGVIKDWGDAGNWLYKDGVVGEGIFLRLFGFDNKVAGVSLDKEEREIIKIIEDLKKMLSVRKMYAEDINKICEMFGLPKTDEVKKGLKKIVESSNEYAFWVGLNGLVIKNAGENVNAYEENVLRNRYALRLIALSAAMKLLSTLEPYEPGQEPDSGQGRGGQNNTVGGGPAGPGKNSPGGILLLF